MEGEAEICSKGSHAFKNVCKLSMIERKYIWTNTGTPLSFNFLV